MSIACYSALKEAVERLEEISLSPEPKPPGLGLGGEMAKTGYKPSSSQSSLPAHAASDEDKFSEITQRLDDLESMIMNVMEKTGMFKKPGNP
jgi:hypothetical protein